MPGDHANPLQRRTAARTTVVWNGLRDALDALGADDGLQQGDRPVVVRREFGDAVNAG